MTAATQSRPDKPVIAISLMAILALSGFIVREFDARQAGLLLVGVGFGYVLMHALFGFTGGWRMFAREQRTRAVRAQLWLLALTSLCFFPVLGGVFGGLPVSAALAPVGISVLVGAFLFGIGMQLGGGSGSGTLFTVGWGQTDMLLTLCFFIIGATLGSVHLPWWLTLPNLGTVSIIENMGWLNGLLAQLVVLSALYLIALRLSVRGMARFNH